MSITARGVVQGGRLRIDIPVDLPDNTEVMLAEAPHATAEDEEEPLLKAALDEAEEQAARGEGSSWEEVRARLHARARDEALPDTRPSQG
ncbi:MAG TPA: hypothetical protein VE093_40765 [Polyangiaceae bacterium]|jgi:hypothetical protein|nr:hypothetical protein [Polyangiaceae bacterium]